MNMDDSIVVSSIIEKWPPSWKEFKKSLKHKKEDLTLKELAQHLRLEEETRRQESKNEIGAHVSKVHVVEDKGNGKGKISYNKKCNNKNQPNSDSKKKKGACWFYSKPGHFKSECRSFNNKKLEHQSPRINLWLLFSRLIYSRMLTIGGSILKLQGMFAMIRAFSTPMNRWMMEQFSTWATLQQLLLKAKAQWI